MERIDIYKIIDDERTYQDRKWGVSEQHSHDVGAYLTLIRTFLHKAEIAYTCNAGDHWSLDELRKVASLCVACMEEHGAIARDPIDFVKQSNNFIVSERARKHNKQLHVNILEE